MSEILLIVTGQELLQDWYLPVDKKKTVFLF